MYFRDESSDYHLNVLLFRVDDFAGRPLLLEETDDQTEDNLDSTSRSIFSKEKESPSAATCAYAPLKGSSSSSRNRPVVKRKSHLFSNRRFLLLRPFRGSDTESPAAVRDFCFRLKPRSHDRSKLER